MIGLGHGGTVQRDEVGFPEKLLQFGARLRAQCRRDIGRWREGIVVDHLHAEALVRSLRHRPCDPTHADQTQRLPGDLGAQHVRGSPAGPLPCPQMTLTLSRPARDHQEERHRGVGSGIGEDVGCIGDGQPAGLGCFGIDVVEADAEVGEKSRAPWLRREHLRVELVGHGAEQGVGALERIAQARRARADGRRY